MFFFVCGIIYRTLFHVLGFQFGDLFASLVEIFASLRKTTRICMWEYEKVWKEKRERKIYLLNLVPQILQIVAMILGLFVGGVIKYQPTGYEGQQYFDKFKFDAFLHFLYAKYIAQRFLNVFTLMHAQTGIGLQNWKIEENSRIFRESVNDEWLVKMEMR